MLLFVILKWITSELFTFFAYKLTIEAKHHLCALRIIFNISSFVSSVIYNMFRPVLGHNQRSNSYTSLELSASFTFCICTCISGWLFYKFLWFVIFDFPIPRSEPAASLIIRTFRISPSYRIQDTIVKTAVVPSYVREYEWFSSLWSSWDRNLLQITLQTSLVL
jgi:hypothetical protein